MKKPASLTLGCLLVVLVWGASAPAAGGPPIARQTAHVIDEPFGGVGLNCATGNLSVSDGRFSGVLHTSVLGNGSVHLHGALRGTDSLDDLPTDGVTDATTTFVNTFNDIVLPNGAEVHTYTLHGKLIVTATGARLAFHVVVALVLAPDGTPRVDRLRFVCD